MCGCPRPFACRGFDREFDFDSYEWEGVEGVEGGKDGENHARTIKMSQPTKGYEGAEGAEGGMAGLRTCKNDPESQSTKRQEEESDPDKNYIVKVPERTDIPTMIRATPLLRVKAKITVKNSVRESLRRQHTEFLTVILALALKSGVALTNLNWSGDGGFARWLARGQTGLGVPRWQRKLLRAIYPPERQSSVRASFFYSFQWKF